MHICDSYLILQHAHYAIYCICYFIVHLYAYLILHICSLLCLVLSMFYDMLALNFVSMIDDIAFQLAKLDILGNTIQTAASSKCFRVEFVSRELSILLFFCSSCCT